MATTTGTLHAIKNGMLSLGVCASLIVGSLGFTASAEARAPVNDVDPALASLCRTLQELYDDEINEAKHASSSIERNSHLRKAAGVEKQWDNAGCDGHYGSIAAIVSRQTISAKPSLTATTAP
jgi:hypothetical protein